MSLQSEKKYVFTYIFLNRGHHLGGGHRICLPLSYFWPCLKPEFRYIFWAWIIQIEKYYKVYLMFVYPHKLYLSVVKFSIFLPIDFYDFQFQK